MAIESVEVLKERSMFRGHESTVIRATDKDGDYLDIEVFARGEESEKIDFKVNDGQWVILNEDSMRTLFTLIRDAL